MKATTSATTSVDPRFGKLADIIAFIEQARELGMQVIIELLIQHTSDASLVPAGPP
jgi:maltose alpha-D-glucosyltransferase/alpha-amylase